MQYLPEYTGGKINLWIILANFIYICFIKQIFSILQKYYIINLVNLAAKGIQFNAKNRAKARFLLLKLRKEPRLSENLRLLAGGYLPQNSTSPTGS